MSLFGMQVACQCDDDPKGMVMLTSWDGENSLSGFVEGRRYIWECQTCGNTVCVNMKSMEVEA